MSSSNLQVAALSLAIGLGFAALSMLLTAVVDAWVRLLRHVGGRDRPRCRICGLPVHKGEFCADHEYLKIYLRPSAEHAVNFSTRRLDEGSDPLILPEEEAV